MIKSILIYYFKNYLKTREKKKTSYTINLVHVIKSMYYTLTCPINNILKRKKNICLMLIIVIIANVNDSKKYRHLFYLVNHVICNL